jgi:acetoin utilization protein AcuB
MDLWKTDRMPAIKSVMTPFPYFVQIDDPVTRAEEIMREHGVRHVPVEENGSLVGIATHRDLALLVNRALDDRSRARIRVRQICVRDPYVVDLNEPLDSVVCEMAARHLGSALVTREDRLAGIFTVTDACEVLGEILRFRFRPPHGHDAA